MAFKKTEWPDIGDLVIATVEKVTSFGAYVVLDEYDKRGLLHISELSSTWVKNIRDFVRERQKLVLKVLRVNIEKGQVDLSLRRVTKREKKEKNLLWKKERRADALLQNASEKLAISPEEIYEKVGAALEKEFGGIYEGLEKTAKEGANFLLKLGVSKEIAKTLEKIAKERIGIPTVKVKGILELECAKPNGATAIRDALLSARKAGSPQEAEVHVHVISPPKYRIEVLAEDYKEAERILEKTTKTALKKIAKAGGQGVFNREK
ncbi:MAG: translation initiation factor IF-2 subunit alpha [Candidatus Bathyarchaeota archaeon]|nr:MAG: translation initiation factor IF-2 subunit alpha [Candidatus Bathyarchaeota archaeon]